MNDTRVTEYRFNPAEDMLLRGDQLAEGMWVLAELGGLRLPRGMSEDNLLRRQRFRRVSDLQPGTFTGTWVDGYQETHFTFPDRRWIAKKAPAPDVTATVSAGDVIRVIPKEGPERVMVVARVEEYAITLADLPAEGEAAR